MTLNLVNNFIRDWSEKRSKSYPSLRICRFCDRAIAETTRQWVRIALFRIYFRSSRIFNPLSNEMFFSFISQGTFCCEEAFKFNNIRIEWVLRQSISVSSTISLLPPFVTTVRKARAFHSFDAILAFPDNCRILYTRKRVHFTRIHSYSNNCVRALKR